jgi:adenine-specific DNA-methyltransferase
VGRPPAITELSTRLGPPTVAPVERAALWEGDALELLTKVPDASIALVLTSPPYNIGKPYEQRLDIGEYLNWCESWLSEIRRTLTPDGALWLNLGFVEVPHRGRAVPIPYLLWERLGLYLVQEVVWSQPNGVACKRRLSPRNEKLLWLVKNPDNYVFDLDAIRDPNVAYPNQRHRGRTRCNPLGKNPGDVWNIRRVPAGRPTAERTSHPTQMPLLLADRIIRATSRPGDLVLDPFAGSSTTVVSAVRQGRIGAGFEINKDYVGLISARFEPDPTDGSS